MNFKMHLDGKTRDVIMKHNDKYPIDVVYECQIEGLPTMNIVMTETGEWKQLVNDNYRDNPTATLIGKEFDRLEKTAINDDSFLLSVTYHAKTYNLTITPVHSEMETYYRVIQSGTYLFNVFGPDRSHKHWFAPGYADQGLAAAVGEAIQDYNE